jgi:cbb3-type cytochrome oxidase subunit 3
MDIILVIVFLLFFLLVCICLLRYEPKNMPDHLQIFKFFRRKK